MQIGFKRYDRILDGKETFTIMMPLKKNIPKPRHEWKATVCPGCGRECWYNPAGDDFLQEAAAHSRIRFRCTECALLEDLRKKV